MRQFTIWLKRHAVAIQALAALVTMAVAVAALVGVKVQLDASARLAREQSARDIYREYLNLSIAKPEFAQPDYCGLVGTAQEPAYEAYVDYMLYTAEQAIEADAQWQPIFERNLANHRSYICAVEDWSDYRESIDSMVSRFRAHQCSAVPACPAEPR
jgi:hypothetical protein